MAIYLDYAATVPMPAQILAKYTEALAVVGNPSSIHSFGQSARQMVEESREAIALAVNADRNEVIFTSGGTESNNLAIKGLYLERIKEDTSRKKIVSAYTEHHAVTDTIEWLRNTKVQKLSGCRFQKMAKLISTGTANTLQKIQTKSH